MPDPIAVHRSRRPTEDSEPASPTVPTPQRRRAEPTASRAATAQHDANLLAFVQNARPRPNDGVLYVGMNDESAKTEAAGLRATGATVTSILRRDGATITFEGETYDLATSEACEAFGQALAAKYKLSPAVAKAIGETLGAMESANARDELANIAVVFARGEGGAAIPSRIALSGHSNGRDMHMGAESLQLRSILDLARAMPDAARQIEDIHFSGCFTGRQIADKHVWAEAFPNVKTLWAYSGFAPSAPVGHLQTWERSTRGRADSDPNRGIGGVTTWSARGGIREVGGPSLTRLRELQSDADARFAGFASGKDHVYGPEEARIRQDYETYRRLSTRPELSSDEKQVFESRANTLFFIRFYESGVRSEFANAHGAATSAAFESLGLAPPSFALLTREEALTKIAAFEDKLASTQPIPPAAAAAAPILRGLAELSPPTMKTEWCH